MGYIVRLPALGMQSDRATVVEWNVEPGEPVEAGTVLVVIETEKAASDIEAQEAGVLRRRYVPEGEAVEPSTPLAIVAGADEDIADLREQIDADEGASDGSDSARESTNEDDEEMSTDDTASSGVGSETSDGSSAVSPRARRLADEREVDVSQMEGSGPDGAVVAADVPAAEESPRDGETRRTRSESRDLNQLRQTIARRLGESYREAVHVTEHRTVDAESLCTASDALADETGGAVSPVDVLLVALSAALDEYPEFNATFEDGTHHLYEEHNVGVAVDTDRGLVTPVLSNVGSRTADTVASMRRGAIEDVKSGEFTMADLQNGTFTVTNLGPLDVDSFTPIINPPQVAILGIGRIVERARQAGDGGVAFRRQLPLSLTFDHRVVDGADAARFLNALAGHVEDPWPLLAVDSPADDADDGQLPDRSVTATLADGFAGTVSAGSFEWQYDEPEDVGGTGSAPSPVDLFLGSLGACLSASIRFQADNREVPIESVTVDVAGTPQEGSLDAIDVAVTVDAEADEETLDRIVSLGEQGCYVARLLREDFDLRVSWQRA